MISTVQYEIVLAGLVGAGLTERLLEQEEQALNERFSKNFLERARRSARFVIQDALLKQIENKVLQRQPVGEGGIFAALWHLGEALDMGLLSGFDRIPVRQEFIEICNALNVDPYTSDDAGSILFAAKEADQIIEYFETQQIPVCRIGMMQEGKARVIMRGEVRCYLNKPTAKGDRS